MLVLENINGALFALARINLFAMCRLVATAGRILLVAIRRMVATGSLPIRLSFFFGSPLSPVVPSARTTGRTRLLL